MSKQRIIIDVPIPGPDMETIVRTIKVDVEAEWDADLNDWLLDGEAIAQTERAKAREMGVLLPEQIKDLRERLGLTQKQMSELLRIGAKTWSRWETERERPSHSMNILLRALDDGKLDIPYLRGLQGKANWAKVLRFDGGTSGRGPSLITVPTACADACCQEEPQTFARAS